MHDATGSGCRVRSVQLGLVASPAVEKGTWVRVPYVAYASQTGLTELRRVDSGSGRKAKAASVAKARTNLKSTFLIPRHEDWTHQNRPAGPSGTRRALTVHVVKALRAVRGFSVSPSRITLRPGKGTFLRARVRPVKAATKVGVVPGPRSPQLTP